MDFGHLKIFFFWISPKVVMIFYLTQMVCFVQNLKDAQRLIKKSFWFMSAHLE